MYQVSLNCLLSNSSFYARLISHQLIKYMYEAGHFSLLPGTPVWLRVVLSPAHTWPHGHRAVCSSSPEHHHMNRLSMVSPSLPFHGSLFILWTLLSTSILPPYLFSTAKNNENKDDITTLGASLGAQMVKNWPAMQETRVQSLGREDPLEKGTTYGHNTTLMARIFLSALFSQAPHNISSPFWQMRKLACREFKELTHGDTADFLWNWKSRCLFPETSFFPRIWDVSWTFCSFSQLLFCSRSTTLM